MQGSLFGRMRPLQERDCRPDRSGLRLNGCGICETGRLVYSFAMSDRPISRRGLVRVAGLGAVAIASLPGATRIAPVSVPSTPADLALAEALVHPLVPGSRFGSWTLEHVVMDERGPSYVVLDERGVKFQVDVCLRDADVSAPRGPATTNRFDLFVANQGDGATDTVEAHGLGAMALADVIRSNEADADVSSCHTLRQRLALNAARRHIV